MKHTIKKCLAKPNFVTTIIVKRVSQKKCKKKKKSREETKREKKASELFILPKNQRARQTSRKSRVLYQR